MLQNRHTHHHRSVWQTWTTTAIFIAKTRSACCKNKWVGEPMHHTKTNRLIFSIALLHRKAAHKKTGTPPAA
jgi:hypothetical protein